MAQTRLPRAYATQIIEDHAPDDPEYRALAGLRPYLPAPEPVEHP